MKYIFWDTERIRNTKIYLSAIIITDEELNILDKQIVYDSSVDISKRQHLKNKVNKLKNELIIFNTFDDHYNWFKKFISGEFIFVCFGNDDFISMNDQLKIHNKPIIKGYFYNLMLVSKYFNYPSNLKKIGTFLKVEHEPHNPISDSYVTMMLFKNIKSKYNINDLLVPIQNNPEILDIEVNGSIYNK